MGYNSKYKSSEIEEILDSVEGKQDELISGTNIKTINGESILGSGNIVISGGGGGSSNGGKEIVEVEATEFHSLQFVQDIGQSFEPNKIYYCPSELYEGVAIYSVIPPSSGIGEYCLYFATGSNISLDFFQFETPSDWFWANGDIPQFESNVHYELSVVATKFGNDYIYKAVLTPFKSVE